MNNMMQKGGKKEESMMTNTLLKETRGYQLNAADTWNKIQRVHQIIQRKLQKNFYNKDITAAQFEVLMELIKHRELPMWRIGDLLSVTGGNVTGLIDRLEKKGYVERTRSKNDRRIIMAKITKKGDQIFKKVNSEFESQIEETMSGLGSHELYQFNGILEKLESELQHKIESLD